MQKTKNEEKKGADKERNTSKRNTSTKIAPGKAAGDLSLGKFPHKLVLKIALFISQYSNIKRLRRCFILHFEVKFGNRLKDARKIA